MSKKDLPKSRFANLGDDEDGTDTSSVSSDTSTPAEDSPDLSSSSSMLGVNARAAQPNQGWSSGPKIVVNSENNRSMKGQQRAGNVTAPYLPQSGTFVINAGHNYNEGERQDAGNVSFGNIEPKKMSYPSKKSHKKRSLTDIGSHSRNPKHRRHDGTSEITRRGVPEPNASSGSNYAHNNHSPSTDPPTAQEPSQGGSSSRRPVDQGDGVAQTITGNNDKGQPIVCFDIYDDDDYNDSDDV